MASSVQRSQIQSFTLPTPTAGYSTEYMNSLVRALEIFFQREQEEGNIRGSTLILTALPTDVADLRVGDVYVDEDGFLKIARSEDNFTSSLTSSVGSVTVSIS
jgi:hypothetical protein